MSAKPCSQLKKTRRRIEAGLVRLALRWIPGWSRATVCRVARLLGALGYVLPLPVKRVAHANLKLALGSSYDAQARRRILRTAYETFALVLLDIFWFTRDTAERITEWVVFDPDLATQLFQKRAHVCVTAHLGNWELLGHAVSVQGYPLHSVAAPLINPAVEPYFARTRQVSGQVIIPQTGAIRRLLRILKDDGKIGLLLDQNTKLTEGGRFVDFFGLPAPMSEAGASLAIQTQSEILFGFCIPERTGRYHVHTAPRIDPCAAEWTTLTKPEQISAITQRIARHIEQAIRAHPHAWCWMYKRWKYFPSDRGPTDYPFYAKPQKQQF